MEGTMWWENVSSTEASKNLWEQDLRIGAKYIEKMYHQLVVV